MRLVQVISDYIRRSILTTQGDLAVRGAAQPERLAAGADRTYLRGQGAGIIPAYEVEPAIPATRARLSANQSIAPGAWTVVELNITDYDITAAFNTVTHRWVCNESGIYSICANAQVKDLADGDRIGVVVGKNAGWGGAYAQMAIAGGAWPTIEASDILQLVATDYIQLLVFHDNAANRDVVGGAVFKTYLAIHRLS